MDYITVRNHQKKTLATRKSQDYPPKYSENYKQNGTKSVKKPRKPW